MIVNPLDKGWKIFFHKAHALLAMDIGLNLKREFWPLPMYWGAGIESIAQHDNNQPKWHKRDNLTSSGAPLDYRQRKDVDLEQVKSVFQNAKYKSSFIVLMVSAHFQKLYGDSKELEVQQFLDSIDTSCGEIMSNLGLKKEQVTQCYQVLRFCDDLSLALCQNDFENQRDPIQIDPISGSDPISISQLPDGNFELAPWVFEKDKVMFYTEYYTTTTDFYSEDEVLKNDLDLLHPMRKEFILKKKRLSHNHVFLSG
ncbi:hypothetical protein J2X69_003414 [Algoriphagus sp. 4150]|uniref:DUF3891 family protein n=1 Tax=Algoriphagus sp. 4150 TaxID=2817756 RepID=UPI00285E725E|nr:DUF3891 family protein [Algoriphagus sp. 4150]MDR7131055.1 hypothetical protein [Algoriphagus sp. 4150]